LVDFAQQRNNGIFFGKKVRCIFTFYTDICAAISRNIRDHTDTIY